MPLAGLHPFRPCARRVGGAVMTGLVLALVGLGYTLVGISVAHERGWLW